MELAKKLWDETLRGCKLNDHTIAVYASISDIWRHKLDPPLIKDIKKHGKSLGYKVDVKFERFNWLILKK